MESMYILRPHLETRPEQYVGWSGKMSINNQMVCDHTGKITNLVSKWPGESSVFLFLVALLLVVVHDCHSPLSF